MIKRLAHPIPALTIIIAVCIYAFFIGLGSLALTDPDETFYAQSAKEMLNRGEWTTPYLYGKPQFEKPILIYWLVKVSYMVFGVNEMAARLPSAIFGLLGVIAIYFLGRLMFGNVAGLLSALALATNVEYVIISRACITDMALCTSMLAGVLFFFYGYRKKRWYYYVLSSAAFALATLAKGPIAIALPVVIVFVFLALSKNLGELKNIPFALCFMVFVFIAAPWYLAAYKLHGKEFIDAFFGFHNVTRFIQSEHRIGSQFYYNVPIILGGFFPWSVFLPLGFWYFFKKAFAKNSGDRSNYVFILTWFFAIFIFFSISKTKLPTYIFPSFISLALITGVVWDEYISGRLKAVRFFNVSFGSLVPIAVIGAIVAAVFAYIEMPGIFLGAVVSGLLLVSGFIISARAFKRGRLGFSFAMIIVSPLLILIPVRYMVLPQIDKYESSKEVSYELSTLMGKDEALGSQSNYLPGIAFYLNKFAENLDAHETMVNFLNSDDRVWCVIKDKNHAGLYDPEVTKDRVKPTYLVYKVGKRAIVTNKIPQDGFYIIKREK